MKDDETYCIEIFICHCTLYNDNGCHWYNEWLVGVWISYWRDTLACSTVSCSYYHDHMLIKYWINRPSCRCFGEGSCRIIAANESLNWKDDNIMRLCYWMLWPLAILIQWSIIAWVHYLHSLNFNHHALLTVSLD